MQLCVSDNAIIMIPPRKKTKSLRTTQITSVFQERIIFFYNWQIQVIIKKLSLYFRDYIKFVLIQR